MIVRQWHAQLDLFDTVRRYSALLSRWTGDAPNRERLFVSDFYLATPSLLHKTKMTSEARNVFSRLQVPHPDDAFVKLPSPPVLYNKMVGIQNEALHNMLGRGLCDLKRADAGFLALSEQGRQFCEELGVALVLPTEERIVDFLTSDFRQVGAGKGGLRSATGLMRIGA